MKFTTLKLALLAFGLFVFSNSNAQQKQDPEKMFAAFDTNKDQAVSLEEFKAFKRKNDVPAETLEKRFAKIDADGDGKVTIEEFKLGATKNAPNSGAKQ